MSIKWTRDGPDPRLQIVWSERDGPAVVPPDHRGFGSLLIELTLAQDLNGEAHMTYRPEGLLCTLDFPLGAHDGSRIESN